MKRHAPATDRNKAPIAEVLARVLPKRGTVLEIASGSGQHVVHFAERFPHLEWQPSDLDAGNLESIRAWTAESALTNVKPPVLLDVTQPVWPIVSVDAIVCSNMVHIAPWAACLGLLAGASRALSPGAPLVLYGPYRIGGEHTAPSNAAFDQDLRARNQAWGVRELEEVTAEASARGLDLQERVPMPANNFTLVFRRRNE